MVLPLTTWVLVVTFICILAAWRWSRRSMEKLAEQIPGPPPLPLIGNALELGTNTVDVYNNLMQLAKQYSPTCRLWLGPKLYIALLDPKDVEIVLSNTKYNDKAMAYDFLHPWLGTGLLTSTGQKWHKHRKFITPTFHFKILEQFLPSFSSKADILIERLEKEIDGPAFDVYKYMTLYALDTITDTAMGLNINAQTDETSKYVAAVRKQGEIIMNRMMKPWLYPAPIFNLTPNGRTQKETLGILHDTTDQMIQEKKAEMKNNKNVAYDTNKDDFDIGMKKRVAFLDLLLQKNAESATFTDANIREEVDTFMFEGHDTTSSSLGFTAYLLSKHQDIQEKVYNEVKTFLSNSETPTIQILNEMKYLERVIKESLRLYPSVPMLGREIHEDVKISRNYTLPANCSVIVPVFCIHRNPDIYPEPEVFNPDRFLSERSGENSFAYIPFSAGSRNCIGQKFAMLEMKLAIAKILLHYKLLPVADFEPILSAELIIKSINGIKIKISSRKT